jgi:O-antigen ligase
MSAVSVSPAADHGTSRALRLSPPRVLQGAILFLVLGNVAQIPALNLGDRVAPIMFNDLAVAFAIVVGVVAMANARSLRLNDVALAALVFVAIGALSTLWGIQRFAFSTLEIAGSLAYLARWTMYFALYVVIINCIRARDAEALWTSLERALLVIVAFGIVQAIFMPNFAFIVYPDARPSLDFDQQRHRLVSTILEPNIASGMIVSVLLVQLARMASGAAVPLWKPVLMFAGLVATLSRSGMLALLVGASLIVMVRGPSRRLVRFGSAIALLLLPAIPLLVQFANQYTRFSVTDASAMGRVIVWQRAISTFLDHPWFGIGFNTYGFVQERRGFERIGGAAYSAEGGLLFVAVLTGVVGLAVYLAMLWFVVRRARRTWSRAVATPSERGILLGTAATTVAILVHSMFVNSLLTPWVMEPLWILWGISFVIASDLRTRMPGSERPAPV